MENQNQGSQLPAQQSSIADRMVVTIKGQDGKDVRITKKILMDTICRGMQIPDSDMVQFLTLCQVNQLNPFLREAYLVKYGSQPAQMITSKDAFMKRADRCQDYEGLESGVIAMNDDGVIKDFEGAFMPPKWTLIGGWAKVYRHGRRPYVQRVSFSEYNKNQSTWKSMPMTMIRKVAEVQALREAFPNNLSGLYVSEEGGDNRYIDITDQVQQEKAQNANRTVVGFDEDKPHEPSNVGTGKTDAEKVPEGVDPDTGEILTPGAGSKASTSNESAKANAGGSLFPGEGPGY